MADQFWSISTIFEESIEASSTSLGTWFCEWALVANLPELCFVTRRTTTSSSRGDMVANSFQVNNSESVFLANGLMSTKYTLVNGLGR
ncbi:hypothetical protein OGATHE_006530 [Ogataea polymorpha]|uniref:Uncharacterized protein n=1 Tax=Ogataea polymorpha TaxID=460523 RepID=A0A9P8SY33_9ASCO|nr:hypothetical protein OGATHE_006530 [Ogataea polymorpha]